MEKVAGISQICLFWSCVTSAYYIVNHTIQEMGKVKPYKEVAGGCYVAFVNEIYMGKIIMKILYRL